MSESQSSGNAFIALLVHQIPTQDYKPFDSWSRDDRSKGFPIMITRRRTKVCTLWLYPASDSWDTTRICSPTNSDEPPLTSVSEGLRRYGNILLSQILVEALDISLLQDLRSVDQKTGFNGKTTSLNWQLDFGATILKSSHVIQYQLFAPKSYALTSVTSLQYLISAIRYVPNWWSLLVGGTTDNEMGIRTCQHHSSHHDVCVCILLQSRSSTRMNEQGSVAWGGWTFPCIFASGHASWADSRIYLGCRCSQEPWKAHFFELFYWHNNSAILVSALPLVSRSPVFH